ncbi:MAG: hypothetical protein QOH66_1556 [Actinomycetota bacterium]|jgi:hypothetical protein|nr:hypothetical protein [Actinomycetota bacterium]
MPITVPPIDSRLYDDLLAEVIARIPVHTPEWNNFNRSDPGITLIELFAFLTESLLYRANQIPERNRRKFLTLLGVPLQPAWSARGIVSFSNDRGPLQTVTLNADLEVRAGQVPFRSELALDVLPVETRVYYKKPVPLTDALREIYRQLYASFLSPAGPVGPGAAGAGQALDPSPYETVTLDAAGPEGVDLVSETVDSCVWVALLARTQDVGRLAEVRDAIAGKTLNLGIVPVVDPADVTLPPVGAAGSGGEGHLEYATPKVPPNGELPAQASLRVPEYQPCDSRPAGSTTNVLLQPGVVQVSLPPAAGLGLWTNLEPIEAGVNGFPPGIEDSRVADRLVTWLRIRATSAAQARILLVAPNATAIVQRASVASEVLPLGNGQPDQVAQLSRAPVIPGSAVIVVATPITGSPPAAALTPWVEIDDLLAAGAEVVVPDPRLPPGTKAPPPGPTDVFALDAEAGVARFGDGAHGRRPPAGAILRASYDYGLGSAGNVGTGSVSSGPALPAGFSVTNPIPTWGGADAESVAAGEKQVVRYLQHRDRLVTAEDFATLARRTPGVEVGRVEVLAAYDPQLAPNLPGGSPGTITLMLIPRRDAGQPDAPRPDRFFLDSVCRYLDPRRLVTTELFLRGPTYVQVWVSVGIDVMPGTSVADAREQVKTELSRFLSPLPLAYQPGSGQALAAPYSYAQSGWPLRTPVSKAELAAYATRVPGVRVVNQILLTSGSSSDTESVPMKGLELPRLAGISVLPGDPMPLDQLRGAPDGPGGGPGGFVPVPRIPEVC